MSILIVEDEQELLLIMKSSLEAAGFPQVETAANGQEAYNLCVKRSGADGPFSLVISDWDMPIMNGIQLLKKIRDNPRLSELPFILITGVGTMETVKMASQCGASAILLKPFANEVLVEKVKSLLGAGSSAASAS